MGDEITYTESEVNKMLGDQKTNIRLDGIESTIKELVTSVASYMATEKQDSENLLTELEKGSADRRRCEASLRRDLTDMNNEHHKVFVKKADLKLYAVIIVMTVSFTVGFITWLGAEHTNESMMYRIEQMIDKKLTIK